MSDVIFSCIRAVNDCTRSQLLQILNQQRQLFIFSR